jgi:hypothetical protein
MSISGLTSPLRSLDIKTATYVESIFSKVNEIGTATASTNQVTTDALQRLEVQLATERPETPDTPSLKSLASAISRIENMLSSQQGSIASPRSSPGGSSTGSRRRSVAYPRVGSPRSEAGSAGSSAGSPNDLKRHESHSMFVRRSNSFQNNEPKDTWPPTPPEAKLASGMGSAQELESLKVKKERMDNIILPEGQLPRSTSNSPDVKLDEHITSRGDKNKITDTLLGSYAALLGVFRGSCPEALLGYFKLVCYFRVVALHSRLLASMQNTESRGEITDMDEYRRVQTHLETLKQDIEQARDKCWKEGYNLDEIDIILDSDCIHETLERKVLEGPREDIELLALRKRLHLLRWSNKLERINAWLLQKLASSREEVTLHRSFLPNSRDLGEKQWARLVVKFWPLDKAGEEDEKKSLSTNEAVHSGKGKNTVRVLLEMGFSSASDSSEGRALVKHHAELARTKTPLKEVVAMESTD